MAIAILNYLSNFTFSEMLRSTTAGLATELRSMRKAAQGDTKKSNFKALPPASNMDL